MTAPLHPLPEFAHPPVIETVLGLQFEPLAKLTPIHLGLAWQEFRGRYPQFQEQQLLPSSFERFGEDLIRPIKIDVELSPEPGPSRLWFMSDDGRRIIQLQRDRFVLNWRKLNGPEEYPRYRQLRATFEQELTIFSEFLEHERLGSLEPNQCEVTYVNELKAGDGWKDSGELDQILSTWVNRYSDDFRPALEAASIEQRYIIPGTDREPRGRVRVLLQPFFNVSLGQQVYLLRVTGQGQPDGEGLEGALRFMDIAHEWVVRCFATVTTPHMHTIWGRRR